MPALLSINRLYQSALYLYIIETLEKNTEDLLLKLYEENKDDTQEYDENEIDLLIFKIHNEDERVLHPIDFYERLKGEEDNDNE